MIHPIPMEIVGGFLREHFNLTPEEIAQTTVSFDDEEESFGFDFGDGIQNSPDRTAKLLRLMRVSGSTTENPIAK